MTGTFGLLLLGVLALALLTVVAWVRRYPGRELTRAEGARVIWFIVALGAWGLVARGLATEVAHGCTVDSDWLRYRTGLWSFWRCSPRLLSEGPAGIFVFFCAWAPLAAIAAFCLYHLQRLTRRPDRDSKES